MLVRPPCTNSLPKRKYSVPANAVIPRMRGPNAKKKDNPSLSSSFPRGMRPCSQQYQNVAIRILQARLYELAAMRSVTTSTYKPQATQQTLASRPSLFRARETSNCERDCSSGGALGGASICVRLFVSAAAQKQA